jgi:hypothetical protein
MLDTPVLFLVFNRPGPTARVFEAIRQAQPAKLYVAADGPRPGREEDVEKCRQTREIASRVDWACEVKTLFRDENLGCKRAVSSAIDWFFASVGEGIILEDDCLPEGSFFRFCEELLHHYRHDERVMMISGNNRLGQWDAGTSYHFSKIGAIWGWATWKRAWALYDVHMADWPEAEKMNLLESVFKDKNQAAHRKMVCEKTYGGLIDTWDYPWTFARLAQHGLSVVSSVNLVENIGFGPDATHTKNSTNPLDNLKAQAAGFPLKHPRFVVADERFDDEVFYRTVNYRIEKKTLKSSLLDLIR